MLASERAEQVRQWQEDYRRLSYSRPLPSVVPIERVRQIEAEPSPPPRPPIVRDILFLGTGQPATPDAPLSVQRIKARVAARHGIDAAEIDGDRRCRRIVLARWEAILEVYKAHPKWGTPRIGKAFGRDHTTIISALRKMGVRP